NRGVIAQYAESIYVGYRHYETAETPLAFPFGHGLSYTRFAYSDAHAEVVDGQVRASLRVTNVGDRDGADVVQLYVRNNRGEVFKAERELRACQKVHVPAGGEVEVQLEFPLADLSYWDVRTHAWVLENGDYELLFAESVREVRQALPLAVTGHASSRSPYPPE